MYFWCSINWGKVVEKETDPCEYPPLESERIFTLEKLQSDPNPMFHLCCPPSLKCTALQSALLCTAIHQMHYIHSALLSITAPLPLLLVQLHRYHHHPAGQCHPHLPRVRRRERTTVTQCSLTSSPSTTRTTTRAARASNLPSSTTSTCQSCARRGKYEFLFNWLFGN